MMGLTREQLLELLKAFSKVEGFLLANGVGNDEIFQTIDYPINLLTEALLEVKRD
jgi:hypothetical protein